MNTYKISIRSKALKELSKLPKKQQIAISRAIKALSENPLPHGYKKLRGAFDAYRIRIGDYRVIYSILDDQLIIDVIRIRHRKDVYR